MISYRGKTEKILIVYGLYKETVTEIMTLYRKTKVVVSSANEDTKFLDIVTGVLPGDTLALYLFIITLDNVFERR